MRLSRYRMNHNIGVRVTYLKCSLVGCLHICRLLENLAHAVPPFEVGTTADSDHNHQFKVPRERGLAVPQKDIITL